MDGEDSRRYKMLSNKEIANIKQKSEDKSCQLCAHFPVCKIYHGFVLNLKSIEVKEIKPEELAKICPFYSAILIGGVRP